MKCHYTAIIIGTLFFFGCKAIPYIKPPHLPKNTLTTQSKITIQKLLQATDALYNVDTLETAKDSLKYLQYIIQINPREAEAYWRLARTYEWLYEHESSLKKKDEYAKKGMDGAGKGIFCQASSAGNHYYYAISLGLFFQIHNTTAVKGLPKLIEHGKLAILYQENFDFGGPHRLLGRVYLEAPAHLGGDLDLALEHLEKATKIAPNYAENLLALAKAYLEDDEIKKATQLFQKIYSQENFQDFPRSLHTIRKSALKNLVTLNRSYAEYLLALARVYLQDGEKQKTKTLLEEILKGKDFQDAPSRLYQIQKEAKILFHKL